MGTSPSTYKKREEIRAYLNQRRAAAKCEQCGASPVVFHHPGEEGGVRNWLSRAAMNVWSLARIDAEIAKCTPLCYTHHKIEHALIRRRAGFRPRKVSAPREANLLAGRPWTQGQPRNLNADPQNAAERQRLCGQLQRSK